jgi:transcriptional regulator with XRE-family HTH domain
VLRRDPDRGEFTPTGWVDPGVGDTVDAGDIPSVNWMGVGRILYGGRKHLQISKREAARRAGISEALWRQLEDGGKEVKGKVILPNPRPENLFAAAKAVGINPQRVFDHLDREMPPGLTREIFDDRLAHRITHLSDRDRQIVERLVDSMLDAQDSPEESAPDESTT